MNSARSASPFAMSTSDNLKYTETLRSKARFLHELSRINEFHVKNYNLMMQEHQRTCNGKVLEFPSEDVDAMTSPLLDQSLLPEEDRKTDSRSSLQRKTVSSSKTIVKVCSKMSLSKRKGKSSKFNESEVNFVNESFRYTSTEASSNEKNVIPEKDPNAEIKRDAFERGKQTKNVSSSRKAKLQNTEVRNIAEPFVNRIVELVEIYPVKKKCLANCDGEVFDTNSRENSMRGSPKEDASLKSTGVDNGCLASDVRSNKTMEKVWSTDNNNARRRQCNDFPHTLKSKDIPTKPMRDQQDLNAVKIKTEFGKVNERTPACQNDLKETLKFKETNDLNLNFISEMNHQFGVKDKEDSNEKLDSKGSRESKASSSKHSSKGVHWSPAIPDESEMSGKSDKMQIKNKNLTMIKKQMYHRSKDQSVILTSSSESSTCESNMFRQDFASSNESEFSSSTNSKGSSITNLSKTESSSRENTSIDLQKMTSNPEVNRTNTILQSQKKIKIFIEKRKNNELVSGKEIDSYGNGDRMVNTGDLRAEEHQAARNKTKIEIKDTKSEGNKPSVVSKDLISEDMELNIILLRTYQHLAYDWQRLKSLSMKLGGSVSDFNEFVPTIQLLGKTIARYKDHVANLNEDSKVKAKIMKYCLKDVNKLIKAVKKNKQYLELQERWVERPEWKSFLDRDVTKKRSFLSNVISFSNEWTSEVSYLIETLSKLVKDFVIKNEEKENLRNQQQYTSDNLSVQKDGSKTTRLQTAKEDLTKEHVSASNQMTGFLKSADSAKESASKTLMKTAHTSGNKEREKLLDLVQHGGAEEKIHRGRNVKKSALASANQWKHSNSRQKCRSSTNTQPVWRPGGAAKIPSSFSATTLAKEKVHQLTKNTKDTKHGRATGEHKKKAHMEAYCMRDSTWPGITDQSKLLNKNSSTSLKTSLRPKSKAGTVKAASKGGSGYHQDAEAVITSKHCDKIVKQKILTEPRIQYAREEIIEPTIDTAVEQNTRYNFQSEPNSVLFKSFSATEKIKINEEEPTRDTDLCPLVKDRIEFNEHLCPEQSFTPLSISSKGSPIYVATCKHLIDKNVGSSRSIIPPTFVSVASASCMANIPLNQDLPVEVQSSKCSRCSLSSNSVSSSVSCQEQKNDTSEQSDQFQENSIDRNSTGRNIKKSPIGRKKMFRTNSRVASLSILKEFLHEQGVDPDLVNKAEQCLKENQKRRSSLKKKRRTSIDVSFSEKNLQTKCCEESRSEESMKNCKGDSVECKENSKDIDKAAIPCLRPDVETKDATTCTTIDNRDASSQTTPSWALSKSSQSIEAVISLSATQTDATSVRHVATEYHDRTPKDTRESKNAACMTDWSLITDYFREIVQASYVSKSVETEPVESNDSTKNLNEDSRQDLNKIAQELIEKHRENKDRDNDQESTKSCRDEFDILLNKMYEDYESSINRKENDRTSEQDSVERETSQSFSCSDLFSTCSDYCIHDKLMMQTESCELLAKVPSRVMATLQIAAIRANSVYKAIDFYKHNLQEKLMNLKKRRKEIITQNRNTCDQIVTNLRESNSIANFTNMVERFGAKKNIKVSQSLRRLEVAASFNKETASTSSTSVSFSEDIEKIETVVSKKCSSKIEVGDERSSKESFVQMEKKRFEQIQYIRQISSGSRSNLLDEEAENETVQRCGKYSVFTRENLLPLVYGVVCSIVFWCLQFTITCDAVY